MDDFGFHLSDLADTNLLNFGKAAFSNAPQDAIVDAVAKGSSRPQCPQHYNFSLQTKLPDRGAWPSGHAARSSVTKALGGVMQPDGRFMV